MAIFNLKQGEWVATNRHLNDVLFRIETANGGELKCQWGEVSYSIDFTGNIETGKSSITNCSIDISKLPIKKGYIMDNGHKLYKMRDDIIDLQGTFIAQSLDGRQYYFNETVNTKNFTLNTDSELLSTLQIDTNTFGLYPQFINGSETVFTKTQSLKINETIPINRILVFYCSAGTNFKIEFVNVPSSYFVKYSI